MDPSTWWYLTRAAGMVSWLMLSATIAWGILLATKAFPETRRPAWLLDLHRWLGGLALSFLAIHLGALIADSYVSFDVFDLLIPFRASWRTGAIALGVFALWALAAVQITSLAMRRLPRRTWRRIHLSSYAVFGLSTAHALMAGSDTANPLFRLTAASVIAVLAFAAMYRVANRRGAQPSRSQRDRATAISSTASPTT